MSIVGVLLLHEQVQFFPMCSTEDANITKNVVGHAKIARNRSLRNYNGSFVRKYALHIQSLKEKKRSKVLDITRGRQSGNTPRMLLYDFKRPCL